MKIFIGALTALFVLVSGIVLFCIGVENVCDSLLADAENLESMILSEQSEQAQVLVSNMQEKWESNTALFMAFSEHNDINSVTDSLTDIENHLFFGDFKTAYCSLYDFKHKISCIVADSKPSLINIF